MARKSGNGGMVVTQVSLARLMALRQQASELASKVKQVSESIAAAHDLILAQLQAGYPVENGALIAFIEEENGSRRVPWREHFEKFAGKSVADQIIEGTPVPTKPVARVVFNTNILVGEEDPSSGGKKSMSKRANKK